MVDGQKIKGDYAYKCECGKRIKIDHEHMDFFTGHDDGNKVSLLAGECPECGTTTLLPRDAIGKTVWPLYKGRFEVRWEKN